jgi:hypothetical protein
MAQIATLTVLGSLLLATSACSKSACEDHSVGGGGLCYELYRQSTCLKKDPGIRPHGPTKTFSAGKTCASLGYAQKGNDPRWTKPYSAPPSASASDTRR